MVDKFEEVEKIHKDELLDLKAFYEKRISALRDLYEKELNIQTDDFEKGMVRSRKMSQTSTPSLQKNNSKKDLNLHLHLNSIEEKVENELETSRTNMMNLQREIKMQNLSECPSLGPRLYTN